MDQVLKMIADERKRQIEIKGYDAEHDMELDGGELSMAAACYCAYPVQLFQKENYEHSIVFTKLKPFDYSIDPKKPEIKRLVIAAALLVAEIERLQAEEEEKQRKHSGG